MSFSNLLQSFMPQSLRRVVLVFPVVFICIALTACPPKRPLPPPPSAPAQPVYYYHTVKYPGETLSIIAGWYTGSVNNWRLLLDHNPGLDPRRIRLGQEIAIPEDFMVKRDPLPRTAVQGSKRESDPSIQPGAASGASEQGFESQGTEHAPSETYDGWDNPSADSVSDNSYDSVESRPAAEATADSDIKEAEVSHSGVKTESKGDAAKGDAAKGEMRIKTREELLRELLEE